MKCPLEICRCTGYCYVNADPEKCVLKIRKAKAAERRKATQMEKEK